MFEDIKLLHGHYDLEFFMILFLWKKKVREQSRECHNHKPQPFPNTKRKRKLTKPNKRKLNKRTKNTKISSLPQAR